MTAPPAYRLRPVELPGDVELARAWYADPDVMRSEGVAQPPADETIENMYAHLSAEGEAWIIEVELCGVWHAIGDAALHPSMVPIAIGDPRYRGRGIARAVLRDLVARARERGWTEMVAHQVYADNEPSLRLFRGAGFVETARRTHDDGHVSISFRLEL